MVLINNTNIGQADVYEALADDVSLHYDVRRGLPVTVPDKAGKVNNR